MKIGAIDINSQFNMYSPISAESIKRIDNAEVKAESVKKASEALKPQNLPLTGGDLYKPGDNVKVTYDKFNPNVSLNRSNIKELDDFSLVSAKEDKIKPRMNTNEIENNYKEIISDDEMDSFLKKAFRLFDSI